MQIELPPALPQKDLNPVPRKKETKDNSYILKCNVNDSKLDKKSIILIQEFVAGLFQVNRYEDVLHLSLLIVENDSNYVDAYYNGSLALFHLQKYNEAKLLMERAPENIWALGNPNYSMACIEVALGNYSSALNFANKAARIDPSLLVAMQNDSDLWAIQKEIK